MCGVRLFSSFQIYLKYFEQPDLILSEDPLLITGMNRNFKWPKCPYRFFIEIFHFALISVAFSLFADPQDLAAVLESEILSKMGRAPADGGHSSFWTCLDCGYRGKKSHVMEHVEMKHVEHSGYMCPVCPKVFRSRVTLRQHRKYHTF